MTPQEKSLIDGVFDRLAQGADGAKDAEAAAHIRERAAQVPDATYGLTQAVLIQEMALNQASAHIAELERHLNQSGVPAGAGSFLGGAGPWGNRPQPAAPQPQPQPQSSGPWTQPTSGGGFLHNMASMAAGVAAGSLLADGIASLFGGRHFFGPGYGGFGGGFGGIGGYGGPWGPSNVENVTVNNYGDDANQLGSQPNDGGYQDASFDNSSGDDSMDTGSFDSGDGGGFDSGGGIDV